MIYNSQTSTTTAFDSLGLMTGYTVQETVFPVFDLFYLIFKFILCGVVIYLIAKKRYATR